MDKHELAQLIIQYEQRIQEALILKQYDKIKVYVKALGRIDQLEKNETITWSDTDWEKELQSYISEPVIREIPDPIYLSASAIELYHQCPLKYRFSYIDKIPEAPSKPQLVFGNIIHRVLEKYHADGMDQSEENLLKLLDQYWESGAFDYTVREDKFKEQGVTILKNYYLYFSQHPEKVISTEFQFSFEIESVIIRGKIDRIDKGWSGAKVIDYKTSKTATNPKHSLQLAIYSLYLQQAEDIEFGGLPETAALFFLRDEDPLRSHTFSTEELLIFRNKILEAADKIRCQEFAPKSGKHCDWCDYKNLLCPAWEH